MIIGICEDNKEFREYTLGIIKEYYHKFNIEIYEYDNGQTCVDSNIIFDIVFMDIELKNSNGLTSSKLLRERNNAMVIVIMTAFTTFYKEAFSFHAFHYLEKPVKKIDLLHCLDDITSHFQSISKKEKIEDSIMVSRNRETYFIKINDILYVEYNNRTLFIVCKNKKFNVNDKLSNFEKKLSPYPFTSPHRSFLVNLSNVKSYTKHSILMLNNECIPISKLRYEQFTNRLHNFIVKGEI